MTFVSCTHFTESMVCVIVQPHTFDSQGAAHKNI